jgi:hypothetical protein
VEDLPPIKRHQYDHGRRSRVFVYKVGQKQPQAENRATDG